MQDILNADITGASTLYFMLNHYVVLIQQDTATFHIQILYIVPLGFQIQTHQRPHDTVVALYYSLKWCFLRLKKNGDQQLSEHSCEWYEWLAKNSVYDTMLKISFSNFICLLSFQLLSNGQMEFVSGLQSFYIQLLKFQLQASCIQLFLCKKMKNPPYVFVLGGFFIIKCSFFCIVWLLVFFFFLLYHDFTMLFIYCSFSFCTEYFYFIHVQYCILTVLFFQC